MLLSRMGLAVTDWQLKTPVAFIIFNRPATARRVFAAIAQSKPPKLLVVADGPRTDHSGEADACAETRAIIEQVDWECQVMTHFATANMGCRRRLSSGLDWVFDTVEQAIILEDDCLPDPSFFRFCEELLHRYRDDERVAHIGGSNFQLGRHRTPNSYYFSRFDHVWGWASWSAAWQHYDVDLARWPALRDRGWLEGVFGDPKQVRYWRRILDRVAAGEIDTWDYQWQFACWLQGALSAIPSVNLVSNIGFGLDSTHTRAGSPLADMPRDVISFPLRHPITVAPCSEADAFTASVAYKPLLPRVIAQARHNPRGLLQQAYQAGASALSRGCRVERRSHA